MLVRDLAPDLILHNGLGIWSCLRGPTRHSNLVTPMVLGCYGASAGMMKGRANSGSGPR